MQPEKAQANEPQQADEAHAASGIVAANETAAQPEVAARVVGVSKSFKGTSVLEDVTFDVAEGESLVLLGASGSGKTTILRILAGLVEPDTGRIVLHGRDVTELPARERGVGVIFQDYALFPRMTVEKNITYGLRIRKRPKQEIKETLERLLALVKLDEHRKKYPAQLSGGQQQRVAIARTLAYQPQVLLFDEPFGALDAQTRCRMQSHLLDIWRNVDVTVFFITHDLDEAIYLADRILVLKAHPGEVQELIEVPVPRPRSSAQFTSPEFIATKARLDSLIHPPEPELAPTEDQAEDQAIKPHLIRFTDVDDNVE
jgi:NitT/TauT family transport system ATP-binding protein